MPSWQLDRYRSSLRLTWRAMRAMKRLGASASSRDWRALTAANSAATKKPLSATSASVARIFRNRPTGFLYWRVGWMGRLGWEIRNQKPEQKPKVEEEKPEGPAASSPSGLAFRVSGFLLVSGFGCPSAL